MAPPLRLMGHEVNVTVFFRQSSAGQEGLSVDLPPRGRPSKKQCLGIDNPIVCSVCGQQGAHESLDTERGSSKKQNPDHLAVLQQ